MTEAMSRTDRETLVKIARQRERVAKSEAKERAARLMADFEQMMDRRYRYDENDIWEKAVEIAHKTVVESNRQIAEECKRLGIPDQFAPKLSMGWASAGRNASKAERIEMRRIAQRELDAAEKAARTAIERQSVQTQEKIMIGGLTTESARQFLEAMPTAESLMPALSLERVDALRIEGSQE